MSNPGKPVRKIKLPDGEAFIEVGDDFIRMGVGSDVFFVLDKASISSGAKSINYQTSPDNITYLNLLRPQGVFPGIMPVPLLPHYMLDFSAIENMARCMSNIALSSAAVGLGVP